MMHFNTKMLIRSLQKAKNAQYVFRNASSGLPDLTKDRYPVNRADFATLGDKHLQFFRDLLGPQRVITDPAECEGYNVDWIKAVRGYSTCVLKPKTTEEVSKILSFCNDHTVAVCPQGGNTGLVGGSVPVFDEVVLCTSQMNTIYDINDTSGVLICQAGCVLESLDEALAEHGLMMPLDLGAKGSCHIGGNVSTNAGGLRLLRYGNLHGNVLGIEAVKPDGQIIDLLSTLKKDNTGFHLKHLFIGSEGSLGVVTKVAIHCVPKPKAVNLAFVGLPSFENVLKVLKRAKRDLGEILASCEMIDESTLEVCTGNLKLRSPIPEYPFYMLIETHGSNNAHDEEKLNGFLGDVMDSGLVLDGTVTNEPSKMKNIWDLRERITEGFILDGYVFKYDVSLPIEQFYSLVPVFRQRLSNHPDIVRITGYGHLGDGNIHFQVSCKQFSREILEKIEPFVYEYTSRLKGSISAEHGIGFRKPKYMKYSKSPESIAIMKDLKKMFDPKGILNPYKVLPP
ncbi:D-2-hydroxyglutarate dehydrogenase, mitochondrial [Anthonomus grandis grandis]|uniref:D-2-hydroxyglutarate dehydrogenase, mitochondrial n=1 Tax=Anthonomus grandis grandis TaxID=2921223 RepID=UPI0021668E36|nr:D-2-hydroxyglutarate dehydrogenase, mitochondrial [Anthonomus grandis grandis]XP_050307085.1 D-2-hydroxyglutarate dehydrogenase, mitochondrial [Anthonomus grandis grandis]XP_050307087.1 D-2-hydroxyglutarate dehydrogenase, mitochondrial [Anthonomus grandis grandis]XP_050307088.1 D-2-hydroxyglutarate dehydrogenase, mitochondrial [Anthonomus grandis grandis]XP_050307089.1 D-2-hydroxyglutarate dehydrogenase, mitochondrial [Anthonomus grandis grandis]